MVNEIGFDFRIGLLKTIWELILIREISKQSDMFMYVFVVWIESEIISNNCQSNINFDIDMGPTVDSWDIMDDNGNKVKRKIL